MYQKEEHPFHSQTDSDSMEHHDSSQIIDVEDSVTGSHSAYSLSDEEERERKADQEINDYLDAHFAYEDALLEARIAAGEWPEPEVELEVLDLPFFESKYVPDNTDAIIDAILAGTYPDMITDNSGIQ